MGGGYGRVDALKKSKYGYTTKAYRNPSIPITTDIQPYYGAKLRTHG
jgi:hypothetical protein